MMRILGCTLLGTMPATVLSQAAPANDPRYAAGQRVRVTAPALSDHSFVGDIAGLDSQSLSLTVTRKGSTVSIPLADITALSTSQGIDRRKGAVRGALVGAALGAVFFADAYGDVKDSDEFGIGALSLLFVSFGITPGIGALAGYVLAPERWVPATVPTRRSAAFGDPMISLSADEDVRVASTRGKYSGRV